MNLKLYNVDSTFCDYLRTYDRRVPHTMQEKSTRPFVGIVFSINNFNYYAPLTSPKNKHLSMKNQIDFLKINNGKWGAINLNNMIPIDITNISKVDIKILPADTKDVIDYKTLLANQISWCNSNKNMILSQAEKLYNTIVSGRAWDSLSKRCCDFRALEKGLDEYLKKGSE